MSLCTRRPKPSPLRHQTGLVPLAVLHLEGALQLDPAMVRRRRALVVARRQFHERSAPRRHARPVAIGIAVLAVLARVVRGAPKDGEEPHEEDAQGRHAGAHDADVDFDGRPDGDFGLVVGDVEGGAEVDEELEADDTDYRDAVNCVSVYHHIS